MYTLLTQCPLFRGLNEVQIEELIGHNAQYTIDKYSEGEVIAHRDTDYTGLMIILSGEVNGLFKYPSGRDLKIDTIEAPQLIAPAFLFGGCNRMPVDVMAIGDVEVLTLHRGLVFEIMQENRVVMSNFIDIISNRANAWSKKIYILSLQSLEEKFASYLLDSKGAEVTVPDVAHVADYFGSTRSALQAAIEIMERRHLIKCNGDKVKIVNEEGLRELLK